jgi:hypothetical protein
LQPTTFGHRLKNSPGAWTYGHPDVGSWQILLQKSPRREARCALASNTSLNLRAATLTTVNATSVT